MQDWNASGSAVKMIIKRITAKKLRKKSVSLLIVMYLGYSLFQAGGIGVMSVGIFARVSANSYSGLMDESGFETAANILIAAGFLVIIIGIIGCCGVMKEKKWLLLLVK